MVWFKGHAYIIDGSKVTRILLREARLGCGSYSERKHKWRNSRRCAAMSGSGLRARYSEEEGIDSLAAAQLEKVRSQLSDGT